MTLCSTLKVQHHGLRGAQGTSLHWLETVPRLRLCVSADKPGQRQHNKFNQEKKVSVCCTSIVAVAAVMD